MHRQATKRTIFAIGLFTLSLGVAGASVHDSFQNEARNGPGNGTYIDKLAADLEPAASDKSSQPTRVKPFQMPAATHYAAIVGRPLFSETRRPPKPPAPKPKIVAKAAPSPKPPPVNRGQFSLVGVIMDGAETYALVRHVSKEELLRVTVGQMVDKWRIEEIQPNAVVVSQRNVKEVVLLHVKEEVDRTATAPRRTTKRLRKGLRPRRGKSTRRVAKNTSPTTFVRSIRGGKRTKRVNAVKNFGLTAAVGKRRGNGAAPGRSRNGNFNR